jgi:hypothetical protein
MKTHFFPKTFGIAALAVAGVLAIPQVTEAKPRHSSHYSKHHDDDHHHHSSYYSYPHSSFVLSLGTGYAGRGYYYGPPGVPYYYEAPGVRYYATRSAVPREYLVSDYGTGSATYGGTDAAVQSELARRGYYNGSIDGAIGPMSRRAIARYQEDHGLPVTGSITSSLLRSLGL